MKRILVIDDNPDTCEIFELQLLASGYLIESNSDRNKGIARVIAFSPDVVICDYVMPGISFENFYEQLRTIRRKIRLILITGSEKGRSFAISEGISVLTKPYHIENIKNVIEDVLASGEHAAV